MKDWVRAGNLASAATRTTRPLDRADDFGGRDIEGTTDRKQDVDRRRLSVQLEKTDIVAGDARLLGELLLAPSRCEPCCT